MKEENAKSYRPNLALLATGTLLFICYYLADCALDSLIFGEGTFTENLISPTAHEMAIRTLSGIFLFTLYLVSTIFINKNKDLQLMILKKTQEIVNNNRELDTYHYAISHQLRGALTRVNITKEQLKFNCYQCESQKGKDLLVQLNKDCQFLSSRIDEMLKFTEANRNKLERKRIAIDDLVREITKDLSVNTENKLLDFQIDNNLQTDCDPAQMQIALKSLIECSIRGTSANHSEIRIGMKKRSGVPIYFIRNTYPQKDMKTFHSKIQKVHQDNHLNQIGIKTARTIIERHGGQLWAKGSENNNPSFYFTI